MNSKLIAAVDVENINKAEALIKELKDIVKIFKIGNQLFTAHGPRAIDLVHKNGCDVFLDLKYHDIPRTVAAAAKEATKLGVFMFNVHCSGGENMLRAAVDAASLEAKKTSKKIPIILGVTILTSLDQGDFSMLGIENDLSAQIINLADMAKKSGINGVVASGKDAGLIKARLGDDFLVACPGIRPPGAETQDQKRVVTIDEAIVKQADFIVVGRPITQAEKPREVAQWINQQIQS